MVGVISDGDALIHVHPMDMGDDDPSKIMVHFAFPAAGMYRLWVQFIDHGDLKTVPLAVKVAE